MMQSRGARRVYGFFLILRESSETEFDNLCYPFQNNPVDNDLLFYNFPQTIH